MAYTQYYAGGWKDSPLTTTPIVAAALQNMESGIATAQSTADTATTNAATAQTTANAAVPKSTVTTNGDLIYGTGSAAVTRLGIGTANQTILALSGIPTWGASLQSLMTATGDVVYASGANTPAKLAVGTTGQLLQVAGGVPVWATVNQTTIVRKNTAKAVTNTVSETDLLNGEFTLAANTLGSTKTLRLYAFGDWVQTSGGGTAMPRFKVKIGSGPTTVIDTGAGGSTSVVSSAARYGWAVEVIWHAQNATNAQWMNFRCDLSCSASGASGITGNFTTGNGTTDLQGGLCRMLGGNTSAIDTTASQAIQLTVINPSASTTETKLQGAYFVVE